MQRLNLQNVLSKFADRTPTVVAQVVDYEVLTPTLARVIMTFSNADQPKEVLAQAISAAFNNNLSAVEGSFRKVSSMGAPAMHGFVTVNREIRPYEDAKVKTMQVVASNMLMDHSDESLWSVVDGVGGVKMLARKAADEDLSKYMAEARVHRHNSPGLVTIATELANPLKDREYAAYVDPESNVVRYGYVLSSDGPVVELLPNNYGPDNDSDNKTEGDENRIAERVGEEPQAVKVSVAMIVDTAILKDADAERFEGAAVEVPADSRSKASMKAFYKELYSYDPAYYRLVEQQIDQHAEV